MAWRHGNGGGGINGEIDSASGGSWRKRHISENVARVASSVAW